MAGAVRDAFLSACFQFLFDSCGSYVSGYFSGNTNCDLDIGELREKLELVLNTVSADLDGAEQKQLRGDPTVEEWIDKLQEAIFDAEDLLDKIDTDALQPKAVEPKPMPIMSSIRELFSPSTTSNDPHLGKRIKKILSRLETIAAHRFVLDRKKGVGKIPLRRKKTPLIDDSEVYGRDGERNALKEMLLSDECGSGKIGVIPIVGMGGLGKTTLAQAVFNDNEVKNHFEPKAWVCVSEEEDEFKVLTMLYEAIAMANCDLNRLYELQGKIQDMLKEKKFLIVLDDIWNEDRDFWEEMSILFKAGAQGSKIIVTSRSEKVANITGTLPTHQLQKLEEEACLKLFEKHAYGCEDFDSNPDLKRIGIEIVKKCKGLPLAVKALGGLLSSSSDVEDWKRIAERNILALPEEGNNILPALRLSYYYLPSHLKKCFAYCAMFPKDYMFEKEELIELWMAENLLKCSGENRRMEEVGDTYFKDLVSRSFFQPSMSKLRPSSYVMHDLMVDLAKSISGKYCCQLSKEGNSDEIEKKTRHLAYNDIRLHDPNDVRFNHVFEATRLRTLLSLGYYSSCSEEVVHNLLLKLKCLRVLSFPNSKISELSDSIGELKHLRYLDLSWTNIMMLPESITVLYNLQTLKLRGCRNLKKLPKDMHNLINLRYLDVRECDKLEEMPRQVSKLKNLQMLDKFFVGKDSGTKIGELGKLSELRGELFIKKLENVGNVEDASDRANLKDKKHLAKLRLEWNNNCTIDESTHARDVLEMLVPNATLKELEILDYPGTVFPNWVGQCNIVFLKLSGCSKCRSLPPLGQLGSLKTLIISKFGAVVNVGSEFYGSARNPFPSLEILEFDDMPSWEHWQWNTIEVQDPEFFSNLREKCGDSFRSVSMDFFPNLKTLDIYECDSFESLCVSDGQSLSSLSSLEIWNCPNFVSFPKGGLPAPNLTSLEVYDCKKLKRLPEKMHELLTSLQTLDIGGCTDIETFPEGGLPLSLTELVIPSSYKLIALWSNLQTPPNLETLVFGGDEVAESFPEEGLLPATVVTITTLRISDFEKLSALCTNRLQQFTSLKKLDIYDCPELQTMPDKGFPASLEELDISHCRKLQTLPELRFSVSLKKLSIDQCDELQTMPDEGFPASLEELHISYCPNLQTLPEQGLPTSLRYLEIFGCHGLGWKCRPDGQYWSKIHHINKIQIDWDVIKSETSTSN